MGDVSALRNRKRTLGRRADWMEREGRYGEAAGLWAEHAKVEARLSEVKRADRVARRRARISRNYEVVSGGIVLTAVEDVLPLLRAAVEIDVEYLPDSYPS